MPTIGAAYMPRVTPDLTWERHLWRGGWQFIAALDEAGRGALAGPVVVGAVILDASRAGKLRRALHGVRDSKQMSAEDRDEAAGRVKREALAWGVGAATSTEIDQDGIVPATRLAAMRALSSLDMQAQYLLTDFRLDLPELDVCQTSLVRGDAHCLSIAAASVLAKTHRDQLMKSLGDSHPGYGLAHHKGYGTTAHRAAIARLGASTIHRQSFTLIRR